MVTIVTGMVNEDRTLTARMPESVHPGPISIFVDQTDPDSSVTVVISPGASEIRDAVLADKIEAYKHQQEMNRNRAAINRTNLTFPLQEEMRSLENYRHILTAAHKLHTDTSVPDEFVPLTDAELWELGQHDGGSRTAQDYIDEERGAY